jgi:hypothetical protein
MPNHVSHTFTTLDHGSDSAIHYGPGSIKSFKSYSIYIRQVRVLLSHSAIDVNRRNNDRLTSFMLAMQGGGTLVAGGAAWQGWDGGGGGAEDRSANAQEKMRRLMDLPATDDLEWTRHDR